MKKLYPILLIAIAAVAASAQTRTFTYDLRGCKFRIKYDAKKYSITQIRGTVKLMDSTGIPLATNATPFTLADLAGLDVGKLDADYRKALADLKATQVVPEPYFIEMKKKRLETLDRYYQLSRASILAYKEPRSLEAVSWAPECSTRYARPLISGGNDLLAAWLDVNMTSRKNNSDPERIRREYEQQYASPDRMRYATLEVMAFGWWNCANSKIDYTDNFEEVEAQFKKLFRSFKQVECYDV